jgi:hypothetical protein
MSTELPPSLSFTSKARFAISYEQWSVVVAHPKFARDHSSETKDSGLTPGEFEADDHDVHKIVGD